MSLEHVSEQPENPFYYLHKHQKICIIPEFTLESNIILKEVPVAYTTFGSLNEAKDNVMVICHALSGSSDISDWWGPLLGPGRALDPTQFFIFCGNVLGSPYGSASPYTRNPSTDKRYGPDFPATTIRDDIRLHKMVLDSMEIKSVAICIGGSLGGMNTLEWALLRGYVKHIVAIATSGRYSAWGISWNEVQRQTICNDKKFMDGYYSLEDPPRDGLCAARIQALLTYRTSESFEFRFARRRASGLSSSEINGIPNKPFLAQTYLQYQGEKFVSRFDANCYLKLLEKMDSHDLGAGREGYEQTLKSIEQPTLIVGIASDGLFKLTEQKELAKLIPKAELKLIESADGHDAFLIEFTQLNRILLSFINRHLSHFKPYANEKQNQAYFQSKDLNGISIPQKVGDGLI